MNERIGILQRGSFQIYYLIGLDGSYYYESEYICDIELLIANGR